MEAGVEAELRGDEGAAGGGRRDGLRRRRARAAGGVGPNVLVVLHVHGRHPC